MATPGILYVDACFTDPQLTLAAYDQWYDKEHIPHLLSMSGCHAARRYLDVDNTAQKPYLTLYPLKDVYWVHTAEFGTAIDSTESDVLPQRSVFKSVLFDGRSYTLVKEIEGEAGKMGAGEYVILTTLEAVDGARTGRTSPASDSIEGSKSLLAGGGLELLSSRKGFKRASQYYLHEDQPDEWKKRWEASSGWPIRDLLIQEFDGLRSSDQCQEIKRDLDAKLGQAGAVNASSRVYKLISAFD